MKSKKMGLLVAAALMSMSAAKAQESEKTVGRFIPLEQLPTEERAKYEQLIREIEAFVRIDWESVTLGVAEDGKLIIRSRDSVPMKHLANPSTWTSPQ